MNGKHWARYRIVNSHTWRWVNDLPVGSEEERRSLSRVQGFGHVEITRGSSPPWIAPSVDFAGERIKPIL